ncbi:uncharacterized protein LOC124161325 [Ischnura elegans]|uniref:uncharacterized protein LOC124161325 n=1 Tax=Ischnura elegans TaxID=197161 RepID=UPI001ED88451|nr:uncharacterized protein LOC124161325 [Ischnura elegans]
MATRETQIKKFEKLNNNQHPEQITDGPEKDRCVVNLTDLNLDNATSSILAKGLNFALAPRAIPQEKFISEIESVVRRLPKTDADEIREDVARVLRAAKPPKPNTTAEKRKALKRLRENKNILVLPADKGSATVLITKEEYEQKICDILKDTTYKKLKTDPTAKTERSTKAIIKKSSIPTEEQRGLLPRASKPPRLYGLPKIHKQGVPLRPIVSQIDAPTYHLAKYLAQSLQPHVGKTSSYVKNSAHFIDIIKNVSIKKSDILVSFDVVSLFTNIPIPDAVEVVRSLTSDGIPKDFPELVEHCLRNSFFLWNGCYYEQTEGAAMGSPLSPVVANLFMEKFEKEALESCEKKPKLWLRYVDDTFVIWPHGVQELQVFLRHLNSQHHGIQFTMDMEKEQSLNFLDVLVTKKDNGGLGHAVYRKLTHTDRYLNAASHHHPSQKASLVATLVNRAYNISDDNSLSTEIKHLTSALQKNGYWRELAEDIPVAEDMKTSED